MPRLSELSHSSCTQVNRLSQLENLVPDELLFNIFLSYSGMGSLSHRSAAFQTQMGFIEVSTALTSLTFYSTAQAMCLLLSGCSSTVPPQLRSPGCVEHLWGVTSSPKQLRCCLLRPRLHPASCRSTAPSSSFHNSYGGWESRDSTRRREEKKRGEKTENSAGTHSSCAMDNVTWEPPGDRWDFNWRGAGEAEKGV